MKLVLVLMIKNESRILKRCLEALEGIVDAWCICDTGSTDNTIEIANEFLETRKGCLSVVPWQNFGYNRTKSFEMAKKYIEEALQWDLKDTYGLLLDADMVFIPGMLREQTLTEVGYTLVQVGGHLEYPNTRLVRMDYPWKCLGVTHEYWDGPTAGLPKSIAYIDDRNDGGCKGDKFERDARLLEQGLLDEPNNGRYMFYLAQTYHSLGRWKDAITYYKKRIQSGGWFEEIWYSHYMIAQSYLQLNNPIKFEEWMLKAYEFRPARAESLYKLTKYFREKSQHYKAYHYLTLGRNIAQPSDSLFIETPVYRGLFDYEATILDFYIGKHREGLIESMNYMLSNKTEHLDNVYQNVKFYIQPLEGEIVNHPVSREYAGLDYHPTSVSVIQHNNQEFHNIRFVNYSINQKDGSYMMKEGDYSPHYPVRTQNVCWNVKENKYILMNDSSVTLPRKETHIKGLEDVRLYHDASGTLRFTATSKEYSENIRIVSGVYNPTSGSYQDCQVFQSPINASCEKNWIPIDGTSNMIYRWSPFEVGTLNEDTLNIHTRYSTPWFFSHLRGSAVPIQIENELWCLTHFVEYNSPRKYFHCIVILDSHTHQPQRISLPFVFRDKVIEYSIGWTKKGNGFQFWFSSWDDNPRLIHVPLTSFTYINVSTTRLL